MTYLAICACIAFVLSCIYCFILRGRLNIALLERESIKESVSHECNLRLQEMSINYSYAEQKLQEANLSYENLMRSLESLKLEYEAKLAQKDSTLAELSEKYGRELYEIQRGYEERLKRELAEQEQKIASQNEKREEEFKAIIDSDRLRQEAIITQRFYELSNKMLDEKARQFAEKQDLSLKPLQEEIKRFKDEIAQNTKDNNEKQTALHTEIKLLKDMSLQASKDASNLANALRGDSKAQGQWGEIILERLLESSGLQKDREYYTQFNLKDDENKDLRPDVLIHLPNNRFVVVDSKVSLNAYQEFVNDENLNKAQIFNEHVNSVRGHIKSLSHKEYSRYTQGNKLDFVIMFMPIEGAYNEIVRKNMDLFTEAYSKGIILSSPSTLMVILRLIHNLWINEAKDKNLQKILNECSKMIKKFDSFSKSMDKIAKSLQNANESFEVAHKQMLGRGSMASYVRNLESYMSRIEVDEENLLIEDGGEEK